MDVTDLRIILYSGNYNYVRDGANQALNKLVEYLLRQGAAVRVYAPTIQNPAFKPAGDLVSIPSIAFPGREEYRLSSHIPQVVKNDIRAFAPNMVHLSSPDLAAHSLQRLAHNDNIPVLASVHTRFETYPSYYNLKILEPVISWILKRFYNKCDALVAPSQSMADLLRDQGMNDDVGIWSRGVDKDLFGSCRRDQNWRCSIGLKDDIPVIGFLKPCMFLMKEILIIRFWLSVKGQHVRGLKTGSPMQNLLDFNKTQVWHVRLPAWTYCSTRPPPKHSVMSRWRPWQAACRLSLQRRREAKTLSGMIVPANWFALAIPLALQMPCSNIVTILPCVKPTAHRGKRKRKNSAGTLSINPWPIVISALPNSISPILLRSIWARHGV